MLKSAAADPACGGPQVSPDWHNPRSRMLVVSNFNTSALQLSLSAVRPYGLFEEEAMRELCSGERMQVENDALTIPPLSCCWLGD